VGGPSWLRSTFSNTSAIERGCVPITFAGNFKHVEKNYKVLLLTNKIIDSITVLFYKSFYCLVHIESIKVSVSPLCTLQMCGGHGLDLVDHSFQVLVELYRLSTSEPLIIVGKVEWEVFSEVDGSIFSFVSISLQEVVVSPLSLSQLAHDRLVCPGAD